MRRGQAHKIMLPREGYVPSKERFLLLKNAEQILTMKGPPGPRTKEGLRNLGVVTDGSVVIEGEKIIAVGETGEIASRYEDSAHVIDLSGKLLMPGFVDPHTHLVFAGNRAEEIEFKAEGFTYREIEEKGGGILKTVRLTRSVPLQGLMEESFLRLRRMLQQGTTTAEVKSGYGLDLENEIKILEAVEGLRQVQPIDLVATFMGAHAIPSEYEGRKDQYVSIVQDSMIPVIAKRDLAEYCDVFCEEGYFSQDESRKILLTARGFGIDSKIHADEFSWSGGAELAAELSAVSAEHLLNSSAEGLEGMAASGVIGVLLPGSSLTLGGRNYADARKMIEMGVPVALGTDLNPNCWIESMQTVVSLGCYTLGLTPAEAIVASTINAAYAVGRADRVGSIEIGKDANLLVMDVPRYQEIPYYVDRNLVEKVIIRGKVVVDRS